MPCCRETKRMQILVQAALHLQTLKVQVQAKTHFLVLHQHRVTQASPSHATHPMTICVPELGYVLYIFHCCCTSTPYEFGSSAPFSSRCFSKFPESVGSGRRRLKKPSLHSTSVIRISSNRPATTATTIIHTGTGSGSC